MTERVQKLIAKSGLCSRRKAEELIQEGRVKVNDKTCEIGDVADQNTDTIYVDNQPLEFPELVYYAVHKPKNYITSTKDPFAKQLITELVPQKPKVFPVGRLDKDATGLLILTNDGDFAQKISHPSNEIPKTYIAVLKRPFHEKNTLEKGVLIDGRKITPQIIQLNKNTIAITVRVGMHKIVKRIVKEAGNYVKHLHRTHIGNFALDVLEGEYREISESERKELLKEPTITPKTFE